MGQLVDNKTGRPLKPLPALRSGVYRHTKKGTLYRVRGVSRNSEKPNKFWVVYETDDGAIWHRPYRLFVSNVEHEGRVVPRFEFVEPGEFVWKGGA